MPVFEIERYELYSRAYLVEAADVAEALRQLFDGESTPAEDSLVFLEPADDRGWPTDEFPGLADKLRSLGVPVEDDGFVPGIRDVCQVTDEES